MSSHSQNGSGSRSSHKKSSRAPSLTNKELTVAIRCRHCYLNYRANPLTAQCPKCKCPANRPLDTKNKILFTAVPPLGLFQAILLRKEAPLAAFQAFAFSTLGLVGLMGIYLLVTSLINPSASPS